MAKVVHLTTVHKPRDNRIFNKECTALADAGLDVTLVAVNAGTGEENGVRLYALEPTAGRVQRLLLGQLRAWRALGTIKPDLVHIHDPELIPMALLWKAVHRRPVIFDAHEDLVGQIDDKHYLPGPMKTAARLFGGAITGAADRFADAVVVATPVIANLYSNPRTVVVRNFPWLKDFPAVTERHEVPGRVVYVGGLTKGRQSLIMLDTILQAGATAVIAGPPDNRTETRLKELGDDSGIDYRGVVTPDQIPGILATGAVGIVFLEPLPNYRESLPTKLFEYMAAGMPFLASDFPHWRNMLDGDNAGVFVDSSEPSAPAAALRELMADPQLRQEMGRRGRKAIEERYNFEADVPHLVGLTKGLLAGR